MAAMGLMIGTPVSRGMVSTAHFHNILNILGFLRQERPKLKVAHRIASCSLIGFARNALTGAIAEGNAYDSLLLIDPDLVVQPATVLRLLDHGGPVVAAPYPTRDWDRTRFAEIARKIEDPAVAEACAATYVGGDEDLLLVNGQPVVRNRYARVTRCGAGILLVRREALRKLVAARPDLLIDKPDSDYKKMGSIDGAIVECFDNTATFSRADQNEEGTGFSQLWTTLCKGEIWTDIEASVTRVIEYRFTGHFASKLKLGFI